MKRSRFFSFAFFVYFLGVSTLSATPIVPSLLRGKIVDQKGQAIAYANVALVAEEGTLLDGAVSGEDGNFSITSAKSGKVKLVVSSLGYTTHTSEEFFL